MEPTVTMSLKEYNELKSIRDEKYSQYDKDVAKEVNEKCNYFIYNIQTAFIQLKINYKIEWDGKAASLIKCDLSK